MANGRARTPQPSANSRAAAVTSGSRSSSATLARSAANPRAMASPIPRAPPAMMADCPTRSNSMSAPPGDTFVSHRGALYLEWQTVLGGRPVVENNPMTRTRAAAAGVLLALALAGQTPAAPQSQSDEKAALKNAGFEEKLDGWSVHTYGATPQVEVDATVAREGKQSL